MTDNRTRAEGEEWRTWFYKWKLELDEVKPVEFRFGAGFGCGATLTIAQGQKISLQKAHKLSSQIGTKLGIPGSEVSATVGSELSETIAYELSVGSEWSYNSRPCEYCFPSALFPDARVKILKRWTLHLPFFGELVNLSFHLERLTRNFWAIVATLQRNAQTARTQK